VRMFPYSTPLGPDGWCPLSAFLTPTGGEVYHIPD
jgi:hypothetical protein